MPVGGHRRVESNRLLLGGDPDQEPRAVIVAVEVGGGAVVDGERYARWPRVKRCGEGDLATEGFDRQVHVDHRTDLLRPSATRADDGRRGVDTPVPGAHGDSVAPRLLDSDDRGCCADLGAERGGGRGVGVDHHARPCEAVGR